MSEPKPFASLSPSLLARKGGAKPAMRPQLQPLQQFHENVAHDMHNDLGWNDMGEPHDFVGGEVVPLNGGEPVDIPVIQAVPDVVRQQEAIVHSIARPERTDRPELPRISALTRGRKAAFTLRLDSDRHLQLRLASTVSNRSAQQLLTDALDRLLADMPDVAELASKVRKHG